MRIFWMRIKSDAVLLSGTNSFEYAIDFAIMFFNGGLAEPMVIREGVNLLHQQFWGFFSWDDLSIRVLCLAGTCT